MTVSGGGRSKHNEVRKKLLGHLPGMVDGLNIVVRSHQAALPPGTTGHHEVSLSALQAMCSDAGTSTFPWVDDTLRQAGAQGAHGTCYITPDACAPPLRAATDFSPTHTDGVVAALGMQATMVLHQAFVNVERTERELKLLAGSAAAVLQFHRMAGQEATHSLDVLTAHREALQGGETFHTPLEVPPWQTSWNAPVEPAAKATEAAQDVSNLERRDPSSQLAFLDGVHAIKSRKLHESAAAFRSAGAAFLGAGLLRAAEVEPFKPGVKPSVSNAPGKRPFSGGRVPEAQPAAKVANAGAGAGVGAVRRSERRGGDGQTDGSGGGVSVRAADQLRDTERVEEERTPQGGVGDPNGGGGAYYAEPAGDDVVGGSERMQEERTPQGGVGDPNGGGGAYYAEPAGDDVVGGSERMQEERTPQGGVGDPNGDHPQLSAEQLAAVAAVVKLRNVFVTGSAGTGKTTTLQAVVAALVGVHGRGHVFVTASTGKPISGHRQMNELRGNIVYLPDTSSLLCRSQRRTRVRWSDDSPQLPRRGSRSGRRG